MWIVAGLGNPGPKYARTRHNVGFMVADELQRVWSLDSFRNKDGALVSEGQIAQERVVVAKPMEFMNLSGRALGRLVHFHKVPVDHVLVVHDEMDIPLGRLRLKTGGGHGGHNGLRSIMEVLGSGDFHRLRCGVGRPQGDKAVGHVLGEFAGADLTEAEILVKEAADAVEKVLKKGPKMAMNDVNRDPVL